MPVKKLLPSVLLILCAALPIFSQSGASDGYFMSNDVRLHYTGQGVVGDAVVLVHGWGTDGERNFKPLIEDLSRDHRVIALDCRGHGESDGPEDVSAYGLRMVEDLVRLLDQLKIRKAHFVGYSMGGMIVMKFVAMHPERVKSAILGGHGGLREDSDLHVNDSLLKFLDQGLGVGDALVAAADEKGEKMSEIEKRLTKFAFADANAKALAACMRGFPALLVTNKELKRVRTPLLAVYSVEGADVEKLAGLVTGVRLLRIEGANHLTLPFKSDFIAAVRRFLDDQTQGKEKPTGRRRFVRKA